MNIFVAGSLWVAGAACVGGLIAYLVRRLGRDDEGRPGNNDAAGQVFTIVGGLHAVLVAFVLISLFDDGSLYAREFRGAIMRIYVPVERASRGR